jgi:hypothetical protein
MGGQQEVGVLVALKAAQFSISMAPGGTRDLVPRTRRGSIVACVKPVSVPRLDADVDAHQSIPVISRLVRWGSRSRGGSPPGSLLRRGWTKAFLHAH